MRTWHLLVAATLALAFALVFLVPLIGRYTFDRRRDPGAALVFLALALGLVGVGLALVVVVILLNGAS